MGEQVFLFPYSFPESAVVKVYLSEDHQHHLNEETEDGRDETYKRLGVSLRLLMKAYVLSVKSGMQEGQNLKNLKCHLEAAIEEIEATGVETSFDDIPVTPER